MMGLLILAAATPIAAEQSGFKLSDQTSKVYYNHAVAAGEVLVEGGTTIVGNVHANGDIDLKKDSLVTGEVSAAGQVSNRGTIEGEVREGAEPLPLPGPFDEDELRDMADRIIEGDVTLEDEIVNDVVLVLGGVRVVGQLGGDGTIIATRDIRIGKEDKGTPEMVTLDPDTRISLIAFGDIHLGKDQPFRGVLRAGRDVSIEKNAVLEGVIVAERRVRVKKDSRLTFIDFDQEAPLLALLAPIDGSFLANASPEVSATFADDFSGIDLDTVRLFLDGEDRTAEATGDGANLAFTPSSALTEGPHTVAVVVRDNSDNETRAEAAFVVDTSPPEVTLLDPANGAFLSLAVVDVTGTAADTSPVMVEVNGVAAALDEAMGFTALAVPLPSDGPHQLLARATDAAGNVSETSVEVVRDTVPPTVTISAPADGAFLSATGVEVRGTVTDASPLTVHVNGVAAAVGAQGVFSTADVPLPEEGPVVLTALAVDAAGNSAEAQVTVIRDTIAPVVTFISPTDGENVEGLTIEVTVEVTDQNPVANVTISGQPASQAGGLFSAVIDLTPGPNNIVAVATDGAGNSGSASITVQTDSTPPSLELTAPPAGIFLAESRPIVELSYEDDGSGVDTSSLAFTVNASPLEVSCDLDGFGGSCFPLVDLPDGAIDLAASVSDFAGNTATASLRFTVDTAGVEVEITEPADGLVLKDAEIEVFGAVGPDVTSVQVGGVAASLSGSSFSAAVPLREGTNMVVALATKANGNTGTSSVEVTRDIVAPIVKIDAPRNGFRAVEDRLTVTGLVNDVVSDGTPFVLVNGFEATVAGGAFMLLDLPLQRGDNVIEAVATDSVGNEGRDAITVTFQPVVGPRIRIASGNGQLDFVSRTLAEPLVAVVEDDFGIPVAGRVVRFEVTRNSGALRARPSDEPRRLVQVPTDGAGRASVLLTLGDTAGEGNNRVRATGLGVAGEVEFCATALGLEPDRIVMVGGDNQRGLVGNPLAMPLEVLVTDQDGNPVAGIAVTFEIVKGFGTLDGQPSLVRSTGVDGTARAVLTLGSDPGINNNVVSATFEGFEGLPATATASGLSAGDPAQTRFSGVVLDNGETAIPGARVFLVGTDRQTFTNDEGQFLLEDVPIGHVELVIDPTESPRPETFPPLHFETVTVAGQNNTIGQPILLPRIDIESSQIVGGDQDVTLIMDGVEGVTLTVFAHSTTFPDGSNTGRLAFSQVHLDKVPMLPPAGSMILAWTIQPAGVVFDPPARVTIPNTGMPPGRVIDISQFDHQINDFVIVGKGTITEDGSRMVSDPGFGITRAGWGGCVPPPPPQTCVSRCDDGNACTDDACVNGTCVHTPKSCDDGSVCTADSCDPVSGCINTTVISCDDMNICNGVEICDPLRGCQSGTPLSCDDLDLCNGVETCDPLLGCQSGTPLGCDDLDPCNGVETCDPMMGCRAGSPLPAGSQCNSSCITGGMCSQNNSCVGGTPVSCADDGNVCNGPETCAPGTGCQSGPALVCDDFDPCNGVETCDPVMGCQPGTPPPGSCPDGLRIFLDADSDNTYSQGQPTAIDQLTDIATYVPCASASGVSVLPSSLPQRVRLVAAFVNDAPGTATITPPPSGTTSVIFQLSQTSAFTGTAGNFGSQTTADFSFSGASGTTISANFDSNGIAVVELLCHDYGGYTMVSATANTGDTNSVRIPLAGSDGFLPLNGWRTFAGSQIINTGLSGGQDIDTNPSVSGNPAPGFTGDGLSNYEEYRGFIVRGRHRRTNPFQKDIFISSNLPTGIAFAFPNLPTATHRVHGQDQQGVASEYGTQREINFNSINNGFGGDVPGHSLQRALRGLQTTTTMACLLGLTSTTLNVPATPNETLRVEVYPNSHSAACGVPATEVQNELQRTFGHEIGHGLHICHRPGNCPDGTQVGAGPSIMDTAVFPGANAQGDPASQYDGRDTAQIRVHVKHP